VAPLVCGDGGNGGDSGREVGLDVGGYKGCDPRYDS